MFDGLFAPRYPERRRVAVNTKDGQVYIGLLWEKNQEYLVLKGAELARTGEKAIPMDGDTIIWRENISVMQVLYGVG